MHVRRLVPLALLLLALPATASAQRSAESARVTLPVETQFLLGFGGALVVGGLTLAVAPGYVERVVERVHDEPGASVGWGLLVLVAFIGAFVALAITVIGLIVAIPMALGFAVVGAVGNALGYLALFDWAVESQWVALILGAVTAGVVTTVPLLGDLVGFIVGSAGVGAMALDYRG